MRILCVSAQSPYKNLAVWLKSKGRQQERTAFTAARLIGCGGRAAAAAAAVVGTHDVDLFFVVPSGSSWSSVPTELLLLARYILLRRGVGGGVTVGQNKR